MKAYDITPQLEKKLIKLVKKDRSLHEVIFKKFYEISQTTDIDHYKNLKAPLEKLKRVHVNNSFVLLFTKKEDIVLFVDVDHHDKIYKSTAYQQYL